MIAIHFAKILRDIVVSVSCRVLPDAGEATLKD
jgi:hypothetical protein